MSSLEAEAMSVFQSYSLQSLLCSAPQHGVAGTKQAGSGIPGNRSVYRRGYH